MSEIIWRWLASILCRPAVTNWLIRRALHTPYVHLPGYMDRFWLFNSYTSRWHIKWLPSIRLHHILREDKDRHLHNHPWTFRSIVLQGGYIETREMAEEHLTELQRSFGTRFGALVRTLWRGQGDTYRLGADEFHNIEAVTTGGAWTMFITWKYQHTWGFKTDEGFVPYRKYLKLDEPQ